MLTLSRILYIVLFHLISPILLIIRFIESNRTPELKGRWKECFGFYQLPALQNSIWIHAVSVGEVEAIKPLVEKLLKQSPHTPILITTSTKTGSSRVNSLFSHHVAHVFLPYDLPFVVKHFFQHFQPKIAIIMETEIWPILFSNCTHYHTKLIIINARLSDKSVQNYLKIKPFIQDTLSHVTQLLAQTTEDSLRYQSLGLAPKKTKVMGNIKLDMIIPSKLKADGINLKQSLFKNRLVWVIGSTHPGEDEIFISLYQQLKQNFPALLLVLAPRHPERFARVKTLCENEQLDIISRSQKIVCIPETDVFLLDSIGELKLMYATADCSFVAGSLVPIGGHNILEPALLDSPVLFGPYMANSRQLVKQMLAAEACIQCASKADILEKFTQLMSNEHKHTQIIHNAQQFITCNRGAIDRVLLAINNQK